MELNERILEIKQELKIRKISYEKLTILYHTVRQYSTFFARILFVNQARAVRVPY